MHAYDLSPLFRSTVGFDRLSNLIDNAFKTDERTISYPPYNIIKLSEDTYKIVMAVAGFKMEELNVVAEANTLTVSGQMAKVEQEGAEYLHRGIATRGFERKFSLADHVKVTGAELADGLLTLHLVREVPEEVKPRMIPIGMPGKTIEAKAQKNPKAD